MLTSLRRRAAELKLTVNFIGVEHGEVGAFSRHQRFFASGRRGHQDWGVIILFFVLVVGGTGGAFVGWFVFG